MLVGSVGIYREDIAGFVAPGVEGDALAVRRPRGNDIERRIGGDLLHLSAALIPGWRAARVSPVESLRAE